MGQHEVAQARAIVVVSTNNPTGSFLSKADLEHLVASAGRRGVPLISDEDFLVVSLLTPESAFREGITRVLARS